MKNYLKLIIMVLFLTFSSQVYSGVEMLKHSTENFEYYVRSEKIQNIDEIVETYENGYKKIVDFFEFDIKKEKKLKIQIFESGVKLRKFFGVDSNNSWMTGVFMNNNIYIVDIKNSERSKKETKKIYLHEFTHYVTYTIAGFHKKTRYLHEGLAVHLNEQSNKINKKNYRLKIELKSDSIPLIKEIRDSFIFGGDYRNAGYFSDYLINNYDLKTIKELLKNRSDFEKVLNKTENELYDDWISYMKIETKKVIKKLK